MSAWTANLPGKKLTGFHHQFRNPFSGRACYFSPFETSTKTISVRLPEALLDDLKTIANKKDVPYQSLLKIYLAERVEE
jgi:predicted DNA binding CopG/RHH family protein